VLLRAPGCDVVLKGCEVLVSFFLEVGVWGRGVKSIVAYHVLFVQIFMAIKLYLFYDLL